MKTIQYTQKIIELFKKGLGSDAISLELKVPATHVRKILSDNGLKRNRQEAIEAKKKAPLNYRTDQPSLNELRAAMYLHSTIQGIARMLKIRASEVKRLKKVYQVE